MFIFLLMITMAILFAIGGFLIWKKERISLIHSYHYSRVSEEDKKDYSQEVGKSMLLIAVGLMINGVVGLVTETFYGWIFFVVFFVLGFIKMSKAQNKYNGGWF